MMNNNLQKAIDNLQIHDVYLRGVTARCKDDFDPKYDSNNESLTVQLMHYVRQSIVVKFDENDSTLLRVFIETGARWIDEKIEDENESILASIEAEYIAEYSMAELLEKACIDEFSLKNASYHVWPYWREFLSNHCDRMHLPKVVVPAVQLAHNRHNGAVPEKNGEVSSD